MYTMYVTGFAFAILAYPSDAYCVPKMDGENPANGLVLASGCRWLSKGHPGRAQDFARQSRAWHEKRRPNLFPWCAIDEHAHSPRSRCLSSASQHFCCTSISGRPREV